MRKDLSIPTPDGGARAFAFHPEGAGPWPAAIMFMDAPAIRPALLEMAERLSTNGYYVLLPDMFWRAGAYEPVDIAELVKLDENARRARMAQLTSSTDPVRAMGDTGAFLAFLAEQREVKPGKVGVFGYCMGGGMALRAAGTFPEQVVAAGAFHPGNLATDQPDSPHLLAPRMKARIYVGGADEDANFQPDQADRLREALDAAGVANEVTIYPGAKHGYAPPDMPVYDREASERHWRELLKLLDSTLKAA